MRPDPIGDALEALASSLAVSLPGVTVTREPADMLAAVSVDGVAVLVDAPTVSGHTLRSLALEVPVLVCFAPPAGPVTMAPALALLPGLISDHAPITGAEPATLQLGDRYIPAYRITVRTRAGCN